MPQDYQCNNGCNSCGSSNMGYEAFNGQDPRGSYDMNNEEED